MSDESFQRLSESQSKKIVIAIEIDGVPGLFSSGAIFQRFTYGIPGVVYGATGLIYGGMVPLTSWNGGEIRQLISREGGSLTLTQRLEPEQGRGSISQISITMIDYKSYMTQLVSPGVIVDEILGRGVTIWLGYAQSAFPDQYHVVFRARIAGFTQESGRVTLQLADPNLGRRQQLFYSGKTKLSSAINYNSVKIQNITYSAKDGFGTGVSIKYIAGGTQGAEVVTVVGQAITIQIYAGVSTPNNIKQAIEAHSIAATMVNVSVESGYGNTGQLIVSPTNLVIDTTVNVISNGDFHRAIIGPNGNYDPVSRTFMKIENEFIEYGPNYYITGGTFGTNTFGNVNRGSTIRYESSSGSYHAAGADVEAWIWIEDHAIDMALKLQLSGFNGPWTTGQAIKHIVYTGDPDLGNQPNSITLPEHIDADITYGLTAGDYVTISGDTVPGNNGTWVITGFADTLNQPNRVIYLSATGLVQSLNSPGLVSFRSKYDTYPISCGVALTPKEVDVARHEYIKATWLSADENAMSIATNSPQACKSFIESEVYLPVSCYSLTRFGRLSVGLTKPPLADGRLRFLNSDNIMNPTGIRVIRSTQNRKFFNEIDWYYDALINGTFTNVQKTIDSESLSLIGLSSLLPIKSKGMLSVLGVEQYIQRRTAFLLSRYKRGAIEINLELFYGAGVEIEAGDVVAVEDGGSLQLPNYDTGIRDIGTQLFEVVERSLNLSTGQVSIKLLGGVGAQIGDRFACISPSTVLGAGSTTTALVLTDSYGAIFPGDERRKWSDYVGLNLLLHNDDWTYTEITTIQSIDSANPYLMHVSPALSLAPSSGVVIEIGNYPTNTDVYDQQSYKVIHSFLDPNIDIVSAPDQTHFFVSAGDIGKFNPGSTILVHSPEWTYQSPEVKVDSVDTGTNKVTVIASLGFTPAAQDQVELVGFADGSAGYRFI